MFSKVNVMGTWQSQLVFIACKFLSILSVVHIFLRKNRHLITDEHDIFQQFLNSFFVQHEIKS